MKILVVGGTGFVGRALVHSLLRDNHEVVVSTRSAERARARLGDGPTLHEGPIDAQLVSGADAIVNLAGAGIFDARWTAKRKRQLVSSRVNITRKVVQAIESASTKPSVLVNASAIGYYGSRVSKPTTEDGVADTDFLAQLCVDWEAAAEPASVHTRVVRLRVGIVLGIDGGALAEQLPLFSRGLGGRLGSGKQWLSWIHLTDMVRAIQHCIEDASVSGPVNAVAPHPVQNIGFTKSLSKALGVPALLPAPALALRAVLGEGATAVLASMNVVPAKLSQSGFEWHFPEIDRALRNLIKRFNDVEIEPTSGDRPPGPGPSSQYVLRQTVHFKEPLEHVFGFFSRAENLGAVTPQSMDFQILDKAPVEMKPGAEINYRIKLGPLPLRWKTIIRAWEPGVRFVDQQERGPYRLWWHEHRFFAENGGVRMEDTVHYRLPFGVLGRLVHRLWVRWTLRTIFAYRRDAMTRRFAALE